MSEKITLHVNVNRDLVQKFDNLYPSSRTRFIENAIKLSLNDRMFFERIFFCDLLNGSSLFTK